MATLVDYLKNNKTYVITFFVILIIGIASIIFTYNDYFLYEKTIVKTIETKEEFVETETISYGYHDDVYKQTIKAKILNGERKGEIITINNEYHEGEAYDQRYHKGDELFVSLNERDGQVINVHIENYKRDKYIVLLLVMITITIYLVGRIKGLMSIISVILNITIFIILVKMNTKGISLVLLSYIGAIIFSILCLLLVSGINKKTLAAIISSITGVTITMLICFIVIHFTKYQNVRFEQLELLTRPYEGIFISELILGGLGAIMDISITMASSLNELIEKDNKITIKALTKSGIEIGKDVMSTMINVLFFTYICSSLANLSIYFRNGIKLNLLLSDYISLEMTRALTGAIGIVITIPIAIAISLLLYKRRLK
jgi:uncharacterized membrane protein